MLAHPFTRKTTNAMTYNSTFQDRAAQAAKAKQAALEQLRSRPPVDEKQAKARMAAGAERDAAKAEKAAAKKAERKAAFRWRHSCLDRDHTISSPGVSFRKASNTGFTSAQFRFLFL